ncbi:MAG: protein TolR [Pseudomonadota bacterium]
MGMSLSSGSSSGRKGRRRRRRALPIADINMTPFIDVMLVLLIIFMVAAPMLTVGVPIELPKSAAKPMQDETQPITVSIKPNGDIYIQETQVTLDDLITKLQAISKNGVEERVFIRGDKELNYGRMMEVMGLVSGAGFKKIGLVTLQEDAKPATPKK